MAAQPEQRRPSATADSTTLRPNGADAIERETERLESPPATGGGDRSGDGCRPTIG